MGRHLCLFVISRDVLEISQEEVDLCISWLTQLHKTKEKIMGFVKKAGVPELKDKDVTSSQKRTKKTNWRGVDIRMNKLGFDSSRSVIREKEAWKYFYSLVVTRHDKTRYVPVDQNFGLQEKRAEELLAA